MVVFTLINSSKLQKKSIIIKTLMSALARCLTTDNSHGQGIQDSVKDL